MMSLNRIAYLLLIISIVFIFRINTYTCTCAGTTPQVNTGGVVEETCNGCV